MTNPDRRSGLDSSFLHLGGGSARRHVAGCTVFAGAPTSYHELLAHVQYSGVDIATVLFDASPEPVPVARPSMNGCRGPCRPAHSCSPPRSALRAHTDMEDDRTAPTGG